MLLVKVPSDLRSIQEACPKYIPARIQSRFYPTAKRCLDLLIVLACAPAVLLVLLAASLVIYAREGGPIFFVQNRVGRGGRVFKMLKLRTMVPQSGIQQTATLKGDPRITPLGKFLRQSHIDELPQLWNIFMGQMTLIGPRPEQPALVEHYRANLPHYDLRHTVAPGLSGWAQVNFGYAADLAETTRKLDFDLEYVRRYGPAIDVIIMVKTFRIYLDPRYVR